MPSNIGIINKKGRIIKWKYNILTASAGKIIHLTGIGKGEYENLSS